MTQTKGQMQYQTQYMMRSKIGPLYLVASERGLQGIFWNKQNAPMISDLGSNISESKILRQTKTQLEEYLQGERKAFDVPIDPQGTPFQMQVWKQLTKIPYGQTLSYSELARQIKRDQAVRAVGTANGKNPLCIIIPCHRVIAANGTLGGYSGGLELKKKLLALEQNKLSPSL